MQHASEQAPSGMMSVFVNRQSELNLAMLGARKWCAKLRIDEPHVCEIANYLYSGCKVIGGNKEALEFIELNQKEFKLVRTKRLAVSGAFHTNLMRPACNKLQKELATIKLKAPLIKFYGNYDANACAKPSRIKTNLIMQVANPVKWEQTLNTLYYDENLPMETMPSKSAADQGTDNSNVAANLIANEVGSTTSEAAKNERQAKKLQSQGRVYPNVYECGPAAQTGPILKAINRRAFEFYKHIPV
jgi:malonyl CoA-acyl carrier protein transacylase